MISGLMGQISAFGRRIVWLVRWVCRISASDGEEVLFRLRLLDPVKREASGTFLFPWGRFEYLSAGNLLAQYREIFVLQQYAFECEKIAPVIVDCGGNVGMSAVWFKQRYPRSTVFVYEADPLIAQILTRNVTRLGLSDVIVKPFGVWTSSGTMGFQRRGPDAGSLANNAECLVNTVRLADCLPEHVDLLKMDIEGGEFEVLRDLHESSALMRVKRLVLECHVTEEVTDAFIHLLAMLRESGMSFVIGSAHPKRRLGDHAILTPFSGVQGGQFLLELYAWRAGFRANSVVQLEVNAAYSA